jgi:hypothetical protein
MWATVASAETEAAEAAAPVASGAPLFTARFTIAVATVVAVSVMSMHILGSPVVKIYL